MSPRTDQRKGNKINLWRVFNVTKRKWNFTIKHSDDSGVSGVDAKIQHESLWPRAPPSDFRWFCSLLQWPRGYRVLSVFICTNNFMSLTLSFSFPLALSLSLARSLSLCVCAYCLLLCANIYALAHWRIVSLLLFIWFCAVIIICHQTESLFVPKSMQQRWPASQRSAMSQQTQWGHKSIQSCFYYCYFCICGTGGTGGRRLYWFFLFLIRVVIKFMISATVPL